MPTEEEARWAQMAGSRGGTATMPEAPAAPATPPPPMPQAEQSGKKRGRKEKAAKEPKEPKAPKMKAEKPPKPSRSSGKSGDWVLSLDEGPSRQQMEQEAAAELFAALAPSYDLLHAEVPDAASPEDAQRRIEGQLGPAPQDMDPGIPGHPIWKGDALVYAQLKRHYGRPHQGSSFARSWWPTGAPPR